LIAARNRPRQDHAGVQGQVADCLPDLRIVAQGLPQFGKGIFISRGDLLDQRLEGVPRPPAGNYAETSRQSRSASTLSGCVRGHMPRWLPENPGQAA
jgi:hypothetical protein